MTLMSSLAFALMTLSGSANEPRVMQLQWLTGNWSGCIDALVVEEQWMRPAAGIMLGAGRNRSSGTLKLSEFLAVFERDGTLIYAPRPDGQPGVEFVLHRLTENAVEFRNAAHDFPQFIAYERLPGNTLQVRVGRLDSSSALQYRLQSVDPLAETDCGER